MDSLPDTEITLGTAKLLGLFFGLVIVCAVFFALGYTLGRKSEAGLNPVSATAPLATTSSGFKPAGVPSQAASSMTFYKAVEQKDANAQLAPAAPAPAPGSGSSAAASNSAATQTQIAPGANPPDPMAAIPSGGYFVQVAAVSKQEDAEALVDALKKKQYPAFVPDSSATDKLFRVQIGPFAEIKDAEATRARLINDGYTPILKK
jgi:DedD protein